ncbi:YjbH domain-containing protein [Gammaproteobacteria bacterium]|nr:YjbH domain-containing protein [Gammaproteobacteria bacterium]
MHFKKLCIVSLKIIHSSKTKKLVTLLLFILPLSADNFNFNSYNNHGVVGLINMPTARLYDESVFGLTIYDGNPDQKITLTSNPFDWMEASFFYTSLQNKRYCGASYDPVCKQDYKDKGFNLKLRLKEEGILPAIAIGFNDFAGTGFYSSEYIVGSYGINNLDIHFGLGWGIMNSSKHGIKNPLGYLSDRFLDRPTNTEDKGGQFQPGRYFSGQEASPFFGIAYSLNEKILMKVERDTTDQDARIKYKQPSSDYSFGIDYAISDNFSIGLSHERGAYSSVKFVYKSNPKSSVKKYKYQKAADNEDGDKYSKFIKNLEENGIGVNKISETTSSIGVELTQFVHPNIGLIEEIISSAAMDAGINKNIKKDLKIADLNAVSEIDSEFIKNSDLIYERKKTKSFNTSTGLKFRPFLASREEFFKGALLLENDSEFILRDNLFFNTNLKYSLADNFDDLIYPPVDTYPAQVRSDVKDYLRNMNKEGVLIGRAQLDYHVTPKRNHHLMISAGILEDMFSGYGFEYLYFKGNTNYAVGFELFDVQKRDYEWGFGTLDYKNVTGSINFYYRNYGSIPFDMKMSYGEYLAGDVGSTIEFSRSFENGTKFGVFASFTNVTAEQFGEGTFDKGIFFNIPIYGNFINYSWKPLTKDPGAKLNRRNSLHDLLVKFRPIN